MSRTAAAKAVRAALVWDSGTPAEERRLGASEARWLLRSQINDRAQLAEIVEGLRAGPYFFLAALQRSAPFIGGPAARVSLNLFEAHLFGAASGGLDGPYAVAFMAEFATAAPFLTVLH
ncbi:MULTISPECIES: hypothetical protein [unclassified Methylobacterium]|uniref:hypothetical protein n=1 Tax=unclassified Methylobacterium TaxID=2615210 RepID=UPI0011C1F101|nr:MULTISPECIES: hypothetical protein [unclassified Methylobacterium]QEE40660.1 hypothetical protein FVA80_18360 [Methylobacterium sp. WL1]TXN58016.1 hypothetical protein FV241_08550 [Methylobacterium sp. WL2]